MLEEIKNTFDDIRDALIEAGAEVSECDSPTTYANRILSLAQGTGLNVTCIPAFKSSETKPETPTTPASASEPQNLPDGWSTPDGLTGTIGMTYTIVGNTYIYVPGTEPIQITNIKNKITRTFTIYLELSSRSVTPGSPEGGYGDSERNILTGDIVSILSNGNIGHWSTTNSHVNGSYTGISSATFSSDATDNSYGPSTGSTPICINAARDGIDGVDGRDGADGCNAEYIYKLVTDLVEFENLPTPPSNPTVTDYVPEGGSDHPIGIDAEHQIEAVCVRLLKNGQGGAFSAPVIWSIGSESGIDGDGIEYIFTTVAPGDQARRNVIKDPSTGQYNLNPILGPPISEEMYLATTRDAGVSDAEALERYQQDEFIPGDSASDLGWDRNGVDNSINSDSAHPFVFCSKRKYDGSTHSGDGFTQPVLWNKYPYDDTSVYNVQAYTKSYLNLTTASVSGKTYDSDHGVIPEATTQGGEPVNINWYSKVPNNLNGDVWMVSCLYGSEMETLDWTSPTKLDDTYLFQIEYSANYNGTTKLQLDNLNNYIDVTNSEGINEVAGRTAMHNTNRGDGSDDANGAMYMATCHRINGSGTDGIVAKIQDNEVRGQVSTLQADFAQIDTIIANKVNTMSLSANKIQCDSNDVDITIQDGGFKASSKRQGNLSKVMIGLDNDGCPQLLFYNENGVMTGGYTKSGGTPISTPYDTHVAYYYPCFKDQYDAPLTNKDDIIEKGLDLSTLTVNSPTNVYISINDGKYYSDQALSTTVSDGVWKDVGPGGGPTFEYKQYKYGDEDTDASEFLADYSAFKQYFDPSVGVGQNTISEHFGIDENAFEYYVEHYHTGDPNQPKALVVGADLMIAGVREHFIIYAGVNVEEGQTGAQVKDTYDKICGLLNINA